MSEFNPEGPTPKSNPNPPNAGPQPEQMTGQPYVAPTPPINTIAPNLHQVENALRSIAYLNTQIRESTIGVTDALRTQREELARINTYTENRKSGTQGVKATEAGVTKELNDQLVLQEVQAASQQELERMRNEEVQRVARRIQYAPQANRMLQEYRALPVSEQMQTLRQRGLVTDEGLTIGDKTHPPPMIEQALAANKPNSEQLTIVQTLNEGFKNSVTDELDRRGPKTVERILDAVEDSGIRQLRYGQLTMQDMLRSVGTLAGTGAKKLAEAQEEQAAYLQQHQLWQVQAAEAQARGEQPPPPPQTPSGGLGHFAASHPGITGSIIGGLGGIARVAGPVGQALAIGQIASGVYGRIFSAYAAPTRAGQETGEGFRAGIGARFNAIRLGLNPFDLTSGAQAAEMIAAARSRGFTGRDTMNVAEGLRSVVNDLGISIDQAATFFEDSMRRGGMSVDQVRRTMSSFDDNAKALNMNITEYTQAVLQGTQSLRGMGAGYQALPLSKALTAAVPAGFRGGEGQQILTQMIQQNRGFLTATLNARGIPANILTLTSARYMPQTIQALDSIIQSDVRTARQGLMAQGNTNPTSNDIANWMSQAGPHTKGIDPGFLEKYLQRAASGLGVANQVSIERAKGFYSQQQHAGGTLERLKVRDMTDEQLRQIGVDRHHYNRSTPDEFYYQGRKIKSDYQRQVYQTTEHMSPNELERLRHRTIAMLAPGTLTEKDRKFLEQHIRDPESKFGFIGELNKISREHRKQVGSRVNLPGVSIELKGKGARDLFQLRTERAQAVNSGSLPSNRNPSTLFTNGE